MCSISEDRITSFTLVQFIHSYTTHTGIFLVVDMAFTRPPFWDYSLHVLYLLLLGVLFAPPLVASRVALDTCNGITLKCYTPKTAVAGGNFKARLVLSSQGNGDRIDEIGIDWNGTQLFYADPKQSAFKVKVTSPAITSASTVSWYGSAWPRQHQKTTRKTKYGATFDVDPCAQPAQYISAYASVGGCDLRVDCHPVSTG